MSKNKFTGTATQPQRNRKFCQFNKDQYCIDGYQVDQANDVSAGFLNIFLNRLSYHESLFPLELEMLLH